MMQEWTSFQMMSISMLCNSSFPARLRIVCRAASVFPFIFCIWSSRFPLLFMVIPRYLYASVGSSVWFPIRVSVVRFLLLIVSIWLLTLSNLIWYLFAMSLVMDSILFSSSLLFCISATSSIHRRHPGVGMFHRFWIPTSISCNSFAISSIRFAYSITDRTPACLMLSFILIILVGPNLVFIVAVRLLLISLAILQFFPFSPVLCMVYMIASNHALSYAFVTSRNAL